MRRHKNQWYMFFFGVFACLLCMITLGYAAFSTNLNINVKGNLKNIKTEVDEKVPKESLLFWGQADSPNNTSTILEDKSDNENNMTINGATFDENGLYFDGVDDYGVIDTLNYNNSTGITIDFVAQIFEDNETDILLESSADYNKNNGTFVLDVNDNLCLGNNMVWAMHYNDGYNLQCASSSIEYNNFKHYTITFDSKRAYNNFVSLYSNGDSYNFNPITQYVTNISNRALANYALYVAAREGKKLFTKMTLKEMIIYNRVLTDDEIKTINEGYNKKYKLK